MTLKAQINEKRAEYSAVAQRTAQIRDELLQLENSRADCDHKWDDGVTGYEHEGRYCTECGINELYAPTLALLKWRRGERENALNT